MNVLLLSPGFPAEMPLFTRGLAEVGARVLGIGDQNVDALPGAAREALTDYLRVHSLWDEEQTIAQVRDWLRGRSLDRIECLWEPGMILAAKLRERFGVPGMGVEQTVCFRDKERMKQVLDHAGVRTPRHARARTVAEVEAAAERIGYPLVVKPIAGAGSKDTHVVESGDELHRAVTMVRHVPEVSVEEYIDGEELTYETICAGGRILYDGVSWYRPKPLLMVQLDWVSPQSIVFRDTSPEHLQSGIRLGKQVLTALGFETGFTHMEWFRTPSGEAVFGEIGARPPGARLVHAHNYAGDVDLFRGWAEAVCHGTFSQRRDKPYNVGMVFKRAQGQGRIQRIEGLPGLMARYGEHIANIELSPIGTPKQDHRQVVVGDGWVIVRHADLQRAIEITEHVVTDLRLYAG